MCLTVLTRDILPNKLFLAPMAGIIISQVIKVFYYYFKEKKVNLKYVASAGGFPSSHAAAVMALSLTVGLGEGFGSAIFMVSVFFAGIVMYDAAGVRQAAGEQAKLLNKLIDKLSPEDRVNGEMLKELIGHKPSEVLAGAIIGFFTGVFINFYL
jgi:uncharacterized protein